MHRSKTEKHLSFQRLLIKFSYTVAAQSYMEETDRDLRDAAVGKIDKKGEKNEFNELNSCRVGQKNQGR